MLLDLLGINKVIKQMKCKLQKLESNNSSAQVNSDSRPYKVYTALLNQSETDAPVATVLENTLGIIPIWTRAGEGVYSFVTLSFPGKKYAAFIGQNGQNGEDSSFIPFKINSSSQYGFLNCTIITLGNSSSTISSDNILSETCIEIRVYN